MAAASEELPADAATLGQAQFEKVASMLIAEAAAGAAAAKGIPMGHLRRH